MPNRKKNYPELPQFAPPVLSVCQTFYCDHPFRDLSLSSNTWLRAKNWHARKQICFKDILKLQKWGKSLSGFRVLFSTVHLSESLGTGVSLGCWGRPQGCTLLRCHLPAGDAVSHAGAALSCWQVRGPNGHFAHA